MGCRVRLRSGLGQASVLHFPRWARGAYALWLGRAVAPAGRVLAMRAGLAVIVTLLALVSTAQAQTFTVSNTNDGGAGSLRQAIADANATTGATITFSSAIAGQTITLGSELPLILGNNTIINGGNENITINGANLYRVFFIGGAGQAGEPASTTATIENLTISGAKAQGGASGGTGGGGAGLGGAIFVSSTASLTLSNVNLSSNAATGGNGGAGARNQTC